MFNEIVVGVDDREFGQDAIALAKTLVAPAGRVTLAHVITTQPYVYRGASARYASAEVAQATEEHEREHAQAVLENARDRGGLSETGREFTLRWLRSASIGRGLHELAEVERADLLVLASSRQSLLGRVAIRDDTHAALNGAPCAVAIAPAGFAEQTIAMREVGVGYDGSAESADALEVARVLATEWGARLSAFTAVSVPTSAFGPGERPFSDATGRLVNNARDRIEALGGVEAHAAYGAAAEELTVYSASLDLLIVGSRSYGPIGRLIHGSTSTRLARTARCPLLVVPGSLKRTPPPPSGP